MTRFQSNMNLFSTILLIIALCLPKNGYSVEANNPLADNAKQNENPNVASIISITATNQLLSVTSTTGNPGNKESLCIDGNQTSTIPGLSDIIADSIVISASINNAAQGQYGLIEWFVNDAKVQTGGLTYTFNAMEGIMQSTSYRRE